METVTIDNFDIKRHERYAQDQTIDSSWIKDVSAISQHFEITGTSAIYTSEWEELFEIQIRNKPFASFEDPENFATQSKRFFGFCLAPSIEGEFDDFLDKITGIKADKEEKKALAQLFTTLSDLTRLLVHINSRKVQYQKG